MVVLAGVVVLVVAVVVVRLKALQLQWLLVHMQELFPLSTNFKVGIITYKLEL